MSVLRLSLLALALLAAPVAHANEDLSAHYDFSLKGSDKVAVGKEGKLTMRISPRNGYEVHKEPPARVALTADAQVALSKAELKNAAMRLEGPAAVFEVPFVAKAAGRAKVAAKVKFYLCNDKSCSPTETSGQTMVVVQ